ncbi:hypothetical protein WR25_17615 [Diploscapter pachys]|uniref:BING4 C-terminal domain-containing protein n=1 Tax=Diploscapter pachys TaxID=2018661 RepID=A0A2A2KML5_9BILA|nr:hypothetical protein WR25_17615 [Diploscapter pachys]
MPKVTLKVEDVTPSDGVKVERMNYRDYRKFKNKLERKSMGVKSDRPRFKRPEKDPFPDKPEIPKERIQRHDRGAADIDPEAMRSTFHAKKFKEKRRKLIERAETTARAEILNQEEEGYLEADDGELTYTIRQREIAAASDLASAAKCFDLHFPQFGPYHIDYTDNGRFLLLGGKKGHVASLDWQTKKLHCEHNVMEKVQDISWMHTENIYAVAQKNYLYVYDNQGTELHCVKEFGDVCRLEFLPRHFLLVGGARNSFLRYLDVSIGKMLTAFPTKTGGPLDVICQNPANAIIHTGHTDGTVQLWSPNVNECLVKMLAHPAPVKGITIDDSGTYMATTGIWDVRMFRQLHAYSMPFGVGQVKISQRKMIACAIGNTVQVFKDMHLGVCREPYLVHECKGVITDLQFVPYEDVLGVGHTQGFTSMLVPGEDFFRIFI